MWCIRPGDMVCAASHLTARAPIFSDTCVTTEVGHATKDDVLLVLATVVGTGNRFFALVIGPTLGWCWTGHLRCL